MSFVAVIGCGQWGKNLIRIYKELGCLGAVSDACPKVAQEISDRYNVPCLTLEEVKASPFLKGVVIATHGDSHAQLGKSCLTAEKHVFIEKPLALCVADAEELYALAQEKGKILMTGHVLQYHNAFIKLCEEVASGRVGKVSSIISYRFAFGRIRCVENVFWSLAPHDISMVLGVQKQKPRKVLAIGKRSLVSEDEGSLYLEFEDQVQGRIYVSWIFPYKEQKLVVLGDKGVLVFDDTQSWERKLVFYSHQFFSKKGEPHLIPGKGMSIFCEEKEPLKAECEHFLASMETRCPPKTDGKEAIDVLKVLEASDASLTKGKWINLSEEDSGSEFFLHPTSTIEAGVSIGKNSKIWHFSHIFSNCTLGKNCTIGRNVSIGPEVTIGNHCKIQNNVSVYKGVTLEDGVFCGPSCVFTNVNTPRAEIERKDEFLPTYVERGVTIGANATIICGTRLGAYCFIGAGTVVTKDVKPHALMVGNPAKQIGWVSHAGERLEEDLICPRQKRGYRVTQEGLLEEIAVSCEGKMQKTATS